MRYFILGTAGSRFAGDHRTILLTQRTFSTLAEAKANISSTPQWAEPFVVGEVAMPWDTPMPKPEPPPEPPKVQATTLVWLIYGGLLGHLARGIGIHDDDQTDFKAIEDEGRWLKQNASPENDRIARYEAIKVFHPETAAAMGGPS